MCAFVSGPLSRFLDLLLLLLVLFICRSDRLLRGRLVTHNIGLELLREPDRGKAVITAQHVMSHHLEQYGRAVPSCRDGRPRSECGTQIRSQDLPDT